MEFKCKSVNISYSHVNCLGELGRVNFFLPLDISGIVVKSPIMGGGDPPMAILLDTVMTLD